MNIGILGYGRMGREVEKLAQKMGHTISAVFDIDKPFSTSADMKNSNVLIDFTLADAVINNLKIAAQLGIPVVEGTTGWYGKLDEMKAIKNLSIIYSPNFSIGVYQFTRIAEYAAKLMGTLPDYDCYLHEFHHTGKADSPSGTAKNLADILIANLPSKKTALYDTSHGKIPPDALHVTSTRTGRIPGTHEIGFDSPYDFIELKHVNHNREGLAYGSIRAAEWIVGKSGIYTMNDFMKSL
ncbi:4-hydroxy-tetrahydrodipicolinate reductase [candidate division KSB1 bacterium]|nr:4-hydroxy-tetrahydrodipicolinate reductase [candidate division KSB1 bacterium]